MSDEVGTVPDKSKEARCTPASVETAAAATAALVDFFDGYVFRLAYFETRPVQGRCVVNDQPKAGVQRPSLSLIDTRDVCAKLVKGVRRLDIVKRFTVVPKGSGCSPWYQSFVIYAEAGKDRQLTSAAMGTFRKLLRRSLPRQDPQVWTTVLVDGRLVFKRDRKIRFPLVSGVTVPSEICKRDMFANNSRPVQWMKGDFAKHVQPPAVVKGLQERGPQVTPQYHLNVVSDKLNAAGLLERQSQTYRCPEASLQPEQTDRQALQPHVGREHQNTLMAQDPCSQRHQQLKSMLKLRAIYKERNSKDVLTLCHLDHVSRKSALPLQLGERTLQSISYRALLGVIGSHETPEQTGLWPRFQRAAETRKWAVYLERDNDDQGSLQINCPVSTGSLPSVHEAGIAFDAMFDRMNFYDFSLFRSLQIFAKELGFTLRESVPEFAETWDSTEWVANNVVF